MWSALVIAQAVASLAAGAPADPSGDVDRLTVRQARRIVAPARRGSLSYGLTNDGRLDRGEQIEAEGRCWRVFPSFVPRNTSWGTHELIRMIERAACAVRKRFPGSILGIGNISSEGGGQTGSSVSHKAGRDADIGMYALNRRGKRVDPMLFVSYWQDGKTRSGHLRFDFERNLALIVALLTDPHAEAQYIFVADWLKQGLLLQALREAVDPIVLVKMAVVLHQPGDSNPHQHHFHVRIYCSVADRLHGCLERGPIRPWADLGDEAYAAHVRDLARVVREMPQASLRRRAIERLGEIRAVGALDVVVGALADADARTRSAAVEALVAIGHRAAVPALVAALRSAKEPRWALAVWRALIAIDGANLLALAEQVADDPASFVAPELLADGDAGVELRALATELLGERGRKGVVPTLLALVTSPHRALRKAAHRALRKVTNQDFSGRRITSRRERTWRRAVEPWLRFWLEHGHEPWLEWVRLGLVERGVELPAALDMTAVPALIEAIRQRDTEASYNAVNALSVITGHLVDPRWRTKRNNQRHWRTWWKDFQAGKAEQ